MVNALAGIVFMAVFVEGFIEYIKLGIEKKICLEIGASIVLGVAVAFFYNLDLFALVGIEARVPIVSNICTGLIIARGSNYAFDLIGKFSEVKSDVEEIAESLAMDEDVTAEYADESAHEKGGEG